MENKIEIKSMKDIPVGAIIELRNGERFVNMGLKSNTDWANTGSAEYITLNLSGNGFQKYYEDMTTYGFTKRALIDDYDDYEIIKVYVPKNASFGLYNSNEPPVLIWAKEYEPKKKRNSKFKRGDKFEIEIAEVHTHYDDNGKPFSMYRAKGFSTLTFDDKGLERLRKIESEEE